MEQQRVAEKQNRTGYPSIDKPWLKYYSEEAIRRRLEPNTIYGYLCNSNKEHLDDIALIYLKKRITYRMLFGKIEQCARSLTALGVKAGDIVTIQTLAIPQTVVLLYALSRLGAVANLIYVSNAESEVNHFLKHTGSRLYFVLSGIYEQFSSVLEGTNVEHVILLSFGTEMDVVTRFVYQLTSQQKKPRHSEKVLSWNAFLKLIPEQYSDVPADDRRPIAMVYTGGTSGAPKAVVLTNRSINSLVFQYQKAEMGFDRQSVFMDSLPPFIAFGLTVSLHLPLCMGVKTVLIPDPSIGNTAKQFLKYKPNYYVTGPTQIEAIFNQPKAKKMDFSFLKILATGGDALPATRERHINDLLKTHNCTTSVFQGYGMTELAATVCTGKPNVLRFGTVGIPLPNTNVKIIDMKSGRELSYGQQGELCIMAPSVMLGYYKEEAETAKILKKHGDGQYWIHTGDIGMIDSDGFLTIIGRIKRMISIIEGAVYHKIFPKLLEEQFEKLPGVESVIVVGNSIYPEKCKLVAFVVANPGCIVTETELKTFATGNFASYERPVEYRFISELPRTKLDKVDYRALEREAQKETEY